MSTVPGVGYTIDRHRARPPTGLFEVALPRRARCRNSLITPRSGSYLSVSAHRGGDGIKLHVDRQADRAGIPVPRMAGARHRVDISHDAPSLQGIDQLISDAP